VRFVILNRTIREVDMAKARRKRRSYSEGKRTAILQAAQKEGLTAVQVRQRFGVTPVTYYSWRKKYGAAKRRGAALVARGARRSRILGGSIGQVQAEVQARIRELMPAIVRSEVATYLNDMFGTRRRGRTRRV
jgi:transposase-like protein